MLRAFKSSMATKSADWMTCLAVFTAKSFRCLSTFRCFLPNRLIALRLFLEPFFFLDTQGKLLILLLSFVKVIPLWEDLAAFVKLNPAATPLGPESTYELDLRKPSPGTGQYTIAELRLQPPHES